MKIQMKFCRDCIYSRLSSREYGDCTRNKYISPVSGESCTYSRSCFLERDLGYIGCRLTNTCGKEGRFWKLEKKEK